MRLMGFYPAGVIPYCGAPPLPAQLWARWNLDPILIGALLALLAVYVAGSAGERRWRRASFLAGWIIGSLALISPLCPLSVSLFAARVGQHMVLTLVAAPLVSLGRPLAAYARTLRTGPPPAGRQALAAAAAYAAGLWVWHAPYPYAATFLSTAVYWMMHITLIGAAIWLWSEILNGEPSLARAGAAAFSMVQMGFLGALITLSSRPLYAPHLLTTAAWGLSPLEDQQIGGAIMWVPGTALFLAVGAWMALRLLRPRLAEYPQPALRGSVG